MDSVQYELDNAIKAGITSIVREIISQNLITKEEYTSSLSLAIEEGNLEIVKILVELGANVNCLFISPLRHAAEYGNLDIVKYLVEKGADIHSEWDLALREAAQNGNVDVVKYLISKGANPCAFGDHALFLASGNGYFNTVKYLLSRGAENKMGHTSPLREAARNGYIRTVKCLLHAGANIKECEDNYTLLSSCLHGSIKFTKWLLSKLNKEIPFTPDSTDPEIIQKFKYLITQGINVIEDYSLRYCCMYGYLDGVEFLVHKGINIHTNREEALGLAAEETHSDIVIFLIEKGANIELVIQDYYWKEEVQIYLRNFKKPELFIGVLNDSTETDCYICYEPMNIQEQIVQCNVCKKCLHLECRNKWRPECIYCRQ